MERLTEWIVREQTPKRKAVLIDKDRITRQRFISRLAEYEDLSYTPQELRTIIDDWNHNRKGRDLIDCSGSVKEST